VKGSESDAIGMVRYMYMYLPDSCSDVRFEHEHDVRVRVGVRHLVKKPNTDCDVVAFDT
jgi:hypothetical protein